MAQKIDAAANYGVNAFIFDWYYYDDGPYLQGALERGFLQATNNSRIKFGLMWANHDWFDIQGYNPADKVKLLYPGKVTPATWDKITDLVIARYFKHPSYWKIDGKPYFSIYEMSLFLENFGSVEGARAALDRFRQKAKAAGLPGLHINAVLWGRPNLPGGKTPADWPKLCTDLALDSLTGYTWVHHGALNYSTFPISDYVQGRDVYLKFYADGDHQLPGALLPEHHDQLGQLATRPPRREVGQARRPCRQSGHGRQFARRVPRGVRDHQDAPAGRADYAEDHHRQRLERMAGRQCARTRAGIRLRLPGSHQGGIRNQAMTA